MPSYGGQPIFGQSYKIKTIDAPRSKQENKFFGLSGVETLDGGLAGRYTDVQGVLTGIDLPTFNAVIEGFRSFNDGIARVLVDSRGVIWPYVLLESFTPGDRIMTDPYYGYVVTYVARFRHLI